MKIPFFEAKDEYSCFQACLKMALYFWEPEQHYSDKDIQILTGANEEKWTWQGQTLLGLTAAGYEVVNIENLDYAKFASEGAVYLESIWDEDTYKTQQQYSDLELEAKKAEMLLKNKKVTLLNKEVTYSDLYKYHSEGYVVLVSVNPYTLSGEIGYSSHMVVLIDINETKVTFHDPGPPGIKSHVISTDVFLKSCMKPEKNDNNLIAIKLTKFIKS